MPYTSTMEFWNERFQRVLESGKVYHADKPHPMPEIERSLGWLCENAKSVLDLGCGTGSVVIRCLGLGVEKGLGIDVSPKGVEVAQRAARENSFDMRASFAEDGVEGLQKLESASFEACVLFNIIDNILPADARTVFAEVHRILAPGGRLLLKLNQQLPPEAFEDDYFEEVEPSFYEEKSGLYLWDLSEEKLQEILAERFSIVESLKAFFPDSEHYNRLYQLERG